MLALAHHGLFVCLFLTLSCASPVQPQPLCPNRELSGATVKTPLGVARGTIPINGVSRFAVKYAHAERWRDPEVASAWQIPCVSSTPGELNLANGFTI